jgi:hypothetical protein
MAAVHVRTKSCEATQDHVLRCADYSGYFGNEWPEGAWSCLDEAARRSLCTYQRARMKSGKLETRSRAEYIDEIADHRTAASALYIRFKRG